MTVPPRTILLCSCEDSMAPDVASISRACPNARITTARHLCGPQAGIFDAALETGDDLLVACTLQAPFFTARAAEAGFQRRLDTVNIREHAGWADEAAASGPKMAALVAGALVPMPATPVLSFESAGVALVYGKDEIAIEAARLLSDRLDITVLLTRPDSLTPPGIAVFPVLRGTVSRASGRLGAFTLTVDDFAVSAPSSRGVLRFGASRNGATSRCDLVLDLSGGTPLFPAHHKRPGYLRADPRDPVAVANAVMQAKDLVGTFDKPRFIRFDETLCAHSRSRRTGCSRCLDLCPVGAIQPAGNSVAIDTEICAGCGSCAAVCPTGAASYDLPPSASEVTRLRAMLLAYAEAGGSGSVVLVHDAEHGAPLIEALSHCGPGLPARVIPFAVHEVTALHPATIASALAFGAAAVRVLVSARPRDDLDALRRTLALAEAIDVGWGLGGARAGMIEADDPDTLAAAFVALPRSGIAPRRFVPSGRPREIATTALRELAKALPAPPPVIALPALAPFGAVTVNQDGCTLCLACVSACPTGALRDNPERPMLTFTEDACVQCGLCAATCPEKVIALVPRLNLNADAAAPQVMKQEEPFHCIRCDAPFGVRGTVERVAARLASTHWMFRGSTANQDLIRMCADCRVAVVTEPGGLDPHAGPQRPGAVTTEDYLRTRDESEGKTRH